MDFNSQPIGTKLVICKRGAYLNEIYIFGIVIAGPRNSKRIQIVETLSEEKNNDPITQYTKITPCWDKPKLNEIYCVSTGKSGEMKGLSWLRSYPDGNECNCTNKNAPRLYGVYDETHEYLNCHDSP